jgi:hypothetical protein
MTDQVEPAVRIPRYAYTLADKNWLLDYSECNPKVNAVDHGTALAEYVNGKRSRDQVAVTTPGKSTVNAFLDAQRSLAKALSGGKRQTSLLGFLRRNSVNIFRSGNTVLVS